MPINLTWSHFSKCSDKSVSSCIWIILTPLEPFAIYIPSDILVVLLRPYFAINKDCWDRFKDWCKDSRSGFDSFPGSKASRKKAHLSEKKSACLCLWCQRIHDSVVLFAQDWPNLHWGWFNNVELDSITSRSIQ